MNQVLIHDIFTQILSGLSGSKVTRPGKFRSSQYVVETSLQAEDGLLYPSYLYCIRGYIHVAVKLKIL